MSRRSVKARGAADHPRACGRHRHRIAVSRRCGSGGAVRRAGADVPGLHQRSSSAWPTGSCRWASRRWRWNPPACTGCRCTRCWKSRGIEVIVANAREARAVPGRKSDVNDAQWLQRLHACGLLRASFRPGRDIAALRAYLRLRERHLDYAAAHIQHMQKALTFMNLQLHHVVSDITGVTGMKIIRAIVGGERDPQVLAHDARRSLQGQRRDGARGVGGQLPTGARLRADPGAGAVRLLPGACRRMRCRDRTRRWPR